MDKEKVLNLAKLARIEMGEAEAEKLSREFDAILGYVSEVKSMPMANDRHQNILENVGVLNVMREDGEPHESGLYTEELLALAPQREGGHIKVKKML